MSEYQIEALPVEAQQRVLALREARSLLTRPTHTEIDISPVDLVTVASWIVTGNDPWDSVPAREQVEIEAQAEALLSPFDDEDESDPEPSPTEARIGDYVDRVAVLREQGHVVTAVEYCGCPAAIGRHEKGDDCWPIADRSGTEIHAALERERHEAALEGYEAIARQSTAVTSQTSEAWALDRTETIPAVPAEPTFDEVMDGVGPSGVCAGVQHGPGYVAGFPGQAVKHVGCTFNGSPMTESERAAEAEADRRAWS